MSFESLAEAHHARLFRVAYGVLRDRHLAEDATQQALLDIPHGDTRTYGDLAKMLDVSAQAIGQACGANRLPIFVPCHRVLGAHGLGGFSGGCGIESKAALLRRERSLAAATGASHNPHDQSGFA